jgi:hypothetical protein
MMTKVLRGSFLGGALALAGCASQVPPATVTRFNIGQPIAPGSFAIEPRDPAVGASLEFDNYAKAVSEQLVRLGFTPGAQPLKSELVATIAIDRESRQAGPARSPFSIGLGGGSFGGGVGVGGGVSFPVGKARAPYATRTQLGVQLKRRSDLSVIWEGRAMIEARQGTPYASPTAAVQKLSEALFKGFPGESGQTITVK